MLDQHVHATGTNAVIPTTYGISGQTRFKAAQPCPKKQQIVMTKHTLSATNIGLCN
jgi:hypothetical protein